MIEEGTTPLASKPKAHYVITYITSIASKLKAHNVISLLYPQNRKLTMSIYPLKQLTFLNIESL